ncbi:MAG: stage III sporulation protein AD [Clostridia bacterium]|nr:stage III sporulation protein AD [Clostridia bacterium]
MSGGILVAAVGVLLCAAVLAAVLRAHRPELALGLSIAAGALVVGLLLQELAPLVSSIRRMLTVGGLSETALSVVLRAAGVCFVTQWAADTCRDAGQAALAGKAELVGRVLLLLMTVPLFEQVLALVTGVVG